MEISLQRATLRSWRARDAHSLARAANDRRIADNLRDAFPHPYREADADRFLEMVRGKDPECHFAITVDGHAAGGIGHRPGVDVERVSAEIGYWLGGEFWGRGIMSEVLPAFTQFLFREWSLKRLFALPFARNTASCRVLEKSGYVVEGHLRHSAIKNGEVVDQILYAAYSDGYPWP